jgi:hypothetical protein
MLRMDPPLLPVLVGLTLAVTTPLLPVTAQEPPGVEFGVQGMALLADPVLVGGGVFSAWRPGGKTRLALTLGLGSRDERLTGRAEALAHFLLSPGRVRGVGVYGLGGIAVEAGARDQGYLVVGLGLERTPGGGSGWAVEAGVGGGARIAVGWRWRWLSAPLRRGP